MAQSLSREQEQSEIYEQASTESGRGEDGSEIQYAGAQKQLQYTADKAVEAVLCDPR